MLSLVLLIACGSGKVVLEGTDSADDGAGTDDTGPSGDEGGSSGGDSGGGDSGGGDSGGSSSGGGSGGDSGGSSSGGGSGGGDDTGEGPPDPDYAGTYDGELWMEVPDWSWACAGELELVVDERGGFDQDASCSSDSGWGSYDTPVRLVGTTDDAGTITGLATVEMYYSGEITAEITGSLSDGDIKLGWATEIDAGWGDPSDAEGGFEGRR